MANKKHLRKIITLASVLFTFSTLLYLQNLQKVRGRQRKADQSGQAPKHSNTTVQNILEQLPDWQQTSVASIVIEKLGSPNSNESLASNSRLELRSNASPRSTLQDQQDPQIVQNSPSGSKDWKLSFPAGIPVRLGATQNLVSNALGLIGKKLSSNFDLSQETSQERYGFNQPMLNIDYFGENEELLARVLIGSEVPGIGGYYATVVPGSGIVAEQDGAGRSLFRVEASKVGSLAVEANDLRKQKLAQVTLLSNQQQYLKVLYLHSHSHIGSNTLRVEYKNEKLAEQYSTLNELQSFVMTKPYPGVHGVDQYQMEQLLKTIPNPVEIISYVEDNPADLAVYGLAADQRQEIYAEDNGGNVLDLWLGTEASSDSIYAMEAGYDSVFTVGKKVLAVLNFEPFQIVDKFVVLVDINKIDKVLLSVRGAASYGMQILHKEPETAEGTDPSTAMAAEISGSQLTETKADRKRSLGEDVTKDLYQELLSIFLVGEVSSSFLPVDKAELSVIYFFRDGRQRRADFYNYSAKDYYVVSIDNAKATFVTEKRQLNRLLTAMAQVLQTGQLNIVQ